MNKTEFLAEVKMRANKAAEAQYTNKEVKAIVEAALEVMKEAMTQKDKDLQLIGFASMGTKLVPERAGRNVRTGKALTIPAHYSPVVKVSSAVKAEAAKIEIPKPKKTKAKKAKK